MTTTPVPFYEYVETSDDWRPYSRTVYPKTGDNVSVRGLTLMTWNVWYEPMEENLRHREIFNRIHQAAEEVDVIALQEVTPRFLAELQYEKFVRRQWLITNRWDDAHRKALRENGYGIMFLVNRALEVSVESSVAPFPTSKPGRYGQLLEIKGIHVLARLINAHLDSPIGDTEERARQLRQCSGLLQGTSSTLRVLYGDFNIFSTDELSKVIPMHLEDSILSSNLDPAVEDPDSATLGITFATPDERRLYPPRRSDFVFWVGENWECVRHENRGREPVLDESGNPIKCARGVDGYLHASDHLAVLVDFRLGKGQE